MICCIHPNTCLVSGSMKMPIIGIGTWQAKAEEIDTELITALEVGYRHIDTAYAYGNEKAIGETLKRMFEGAKIKREDLFITTKLPLIGNRREDVEEFLKSSLESLKLDYVDLYIIHFPAGLLRRGEELFPKDSNGDLMLDLNTDLVQLWKGMEEQVEAGRAKSIGLSNFNKGQIQRILDNCRIRPANLQVEIHIYLQQEELIAYCNKNNIVVTAYAPLGSPGLSTAVKGTGFKKEDFSNSFLFPMEDPVILEIAKNREKTPAQILLRYLMQCGIAVIPKSVTPSRIRANYNVFDFELTQEEYDRIKRLDLGENGRMFGGKKGAQFFSLTAAHPEYPFLK